ncbi:hypothetical protein F5884DRAFT_900289 [Xylogone sp. PMI_703]|nr:hypothetical protein F5884DRAFT_900289 [Xylogone sp. PMI_703]
MFFPFPVSSLLVAVLLLDSANAQNHCSKISFNVTATAENILHERAPTNGKAIVGGSFEIVGTYCQPATGAKDNGVLQYFIHGATYNQTVWTGLGISDKYNWPLFATNQGYYTLTLESLGHGENPDRPDPYTIVQGPLQVEINHQILSAIRNDASNPLRKTFDKIVLVAHSYGSSVGVSLLGGHPADVEAFVMTGWSTSLSLDATLALNFVPAVADRLAGLDKGYVSQATEKSRQNGFYVGNFDPAVPFKDFAGADTVGVAELLSLPGGLTPAANYDRPVFAINGDMDALLCSPEFGACDDILNATRALFPMARTYEFYSVPQTGHDLTLHSSASTTLAMVHEWLNGTL